ncbi:nucleotidyltransferase family protein, partial [Moorella stamsii]|uniref:nucleotidyltransferase family protein n=1 Tax=Neomoorella stamsii TaxID=1266720 RepID=UPI00101AD803
MKAIIMAGGEGSRLRPLTCKRPKPLVPVANRPVMEYCVDLLRDLGIKEVGVTLQYLPRLIEEYFGDGSDFGLHLHYFVEDKPLGTAGSVKNAASFLDETFVVVSGDALTDFDLRPAMAKHKENRALATLVLTTVDNPLEYGVVITNPDGSIRSFLEKPSWGEVFSDRVNTGIYILEPEVLELVPEGESFDFSKDLFPRLLKDKKPLYGITLSGYWCDIG